jgi:predicted DNA-binding transcriptional regulator YafY
MADRVGVGRRTIERMRDQLMIMYPDLEEILDPPTKRWKLTKGLDGFAQAPTSEEMAALLAAKHVLERANPQAASAIANLETKLLAALKSADKRRLAPDIEALMQAEAIAVQPGPRASVDRTVLGVLRDALLSLKQVRVTYASAGSGAPRVRTLVPYGILFGGEAYLVAREAHRDEGQAPRMWRVDRISAPETLNTPGGPPEGFSLQAYSERSFGVFQEDTCDVILRVLPGFEEEARRWVFHPQQRLEDTDDGLLIHLHGGGLRELAWSLFRWGGKIVILEPDALKVAMKEALDIAQTLPRD